MLAPRARWQRHTRARILCAYPGRARTHIPREENGASEPSSVRNALSRPWVMRDAILIFCIILPSGGGGFSFLRDPRESCCRVAAVCSLTACLPARFSLSRSSVYTWTRRHSNIFRVFCRFLKSCWGARFFGLWCARCSTSGFVLISLHDESLRMGYIWS